MSHPPRRIITLTTDFGVSDAYAAILKGVVLGISPTAELIDITHGISPQDIMEGAFVLKGAAPYFPMVRFISLSLIPVLVPHASPLPSVKRINGMLGQIMGSFP